MVGVGWTGIGLGRGGFTLRVSGGFHSKTELLSDPNADSPSCVSASYGIQTQKLHILTSVQKHTSPECTVLRSKKNTHRILFIAHK